ncbi:MAG: HAD family hydrolase [Ilumatobacteraceae bacterium]
MALAGARCATGYVYEEGGAWLAHGDPTEAAIDAFARRLGLDTDADRRDRPETARFPFDHHRRRMSVVVDGEVLVKGAPDAVLPRCSDAATARAEVAAMTARGLRVLVIARRNFGGAPPPATQDDAEQGLTLLGVVGMEDPPRPDVREAVDACRRAHVRLAMITGDHPDTAAAIGTEVGLRREGDPVLTSADLPSDDAALGELVDHDGIVVARVSPEDKLRIAVALRRRGHVVAMTGDGVNDAPRCTRRTSAWPWGSPARTWPARPRTWCCWTTSSPRSWPASSRAAPPA